MDERNYDALKLGGQLCFPLYACSREVIKLYKPFLDPLGLTYTQYVVMLALWEGQTMTVKELGDRLFLDSGTLTPLLKKLEAMGLVNRERSKKDERVLLVSLTEKGSALRETAIDVPYEMAKRVNLSKDESYQLYKLLYKLLGAQK